MIINDKFIFIRVPRTASSSMENVLSKYHDTKYDGKEIVTRPKTKRVAPNGYIPKLQLSHCPAVTAIKAMPGVFEGRISFGFVRNPYDRVVSYYYLYKNKLRDFETYVLRHIRDKKPLSSYPNWWNQYSWLYDQKDQLLVSYVGRFENIKEDFDNIMKVVLGNQEIRFDLPHIKKSKGREKVKEYYNDKLQEIVYNVCKKDFKLFNYNKNL